MKPRFLPVLCLLLALLPPLPRAAGAFEPAGIFTPDDSLRLPIRPIAMAQGGEALFVAGYGDYGPGQIIRIDPASLQITARADLDYAPAAIGVSPDGSMVAIAGARQSSSALTLLDGDLNRLGALTGLPRLRAPSVNVAGNDRVLLGSHNALTGAERGFAAIDISNPTQPVFDENLSGIGAYRGVTQGWMDWQNSVLFLNTVAEPALLAIDRSSKTLNEFRPREKSAAGSGFIVHGVTADYRCATGGTSSFLLADGDSAKLTLARYDDYFNTLEVLSTVQTSPRANLRPRYLLASSCDRGVIWVGDAASRQVSQFALNTDIGALEKIGGFSLPASPDDLLLMSDGGFGFALNQRQRQLYRLAPGQAVLGNDDIRAVQRALTARGFSLGAIDGVEGELTTRAIDIFEQQSGVAVGTTPNMQHTLQILNEAPLK